MRQFVSNSAYLRAAVFLAFAVGTAGCGKQSETRAHGESTIRADVARTSYGVVHIRADDFRGLGYGLAYAYAQDNVCMFADSLLTVRGERSRYFGGTARATAPVNGEYGAASDFMELSNEDSDFFFKGYLDAAQLKAGYEAGAPEARDLLAGYAAGYNRYLRDYAGKMPAACNKAAWVRPASIEDMYLVLAEKALHASGQVFAGEIVAGARDPSAPTAAVRSSAAPLDGKFLQDRLDSLTREKLGSNALAVGKDLSATGRGMLLGSPHYPWTSTDRFYQAHLTVPGQYDAMGVILGGIPIVVIGFNKDLAWTHTVTTAVHFTTFKLALDTSDATGTTYFSDGAPVRMSSKTVSVDSLQPDGSVLKRSKTFYFSKHGAVIVKRDAGLDWTQSSVNVLADPNRNNTRLIEQWIGIGKARNVDELKSTLGRTIGLPWVNIVAADRAGNTLFADASVVPNVPAEKFASDCMVAPALLLLDGTRTSCGWHGSRDAPSGITPPAEGPSTVRTDYVGNSNDSYWLSNARALLTGPAPYGYSPLYGRIKVEQRLRSRIGFKQMEETISQKVRLKVDDLQRLAFDNRVHAAELVLPDLLPACHASIDTSVARACGVLAAWDMRGDVDSRGAILFREFWNAASTLPGKWAVPFDPANPVNTPRAVQPGAAQAMLSILAATARKLDDLGIPLDARLGDYQGETRNGIRVPIHGAIGDVDGSYNSIHMTRALDRTGYGNVAWGTSYVQAVTFDDSGPQAYAMLLYGQSVDPASPHYADQLQMYSQKRWVQLPFAEEKVKADPAYATRVISE